MDMTLTGRPVNAQEALHIGLISFYYFFFILFCQTAIKTNFYLLTLIIIFPGLVSHVFEEGQVLSGAIEMAKKIGAFPQRCLRSGNMEINTHIHQNHIIHLPPRPTLNIQLF